MKNIRRILKALNMLSLGHETGATFLEKTAKMDSIAKTQAMQTYLLGALSDPSLIGNYSVMHNNAIYKYGYGHPRTHKIAAKQVTGSSRRLSPPTKEITISLSLNGSSSKKDKKAKSAQPRFDTSNMGHLKRDENSPHVRGKFIMDQLITAAEAEKAAVAWAEDGTLGPEIKKRKIMELAQIAAHVHNIYKREKNVFRKRASKPDQDPRSRFTELPIEVRQDELRSSRGPDDATLSRWRASYAYLYDAEQNLKNGKQGWSRFPWNVAFRALCTIKAAALGPYQVVTSNFYERFKLVNPR
ncbi:hypothetical protein BJ912DRAFT_1056008 [Pholiota molesta]|nr:hypothetical protein BJ912DRAFT_1056008 [Pholiota molesta]